MSGAHVMHTVCKHRCAAFHNCIGVPRERDTKNIEVRKRSLQPFAVDDTKRGFRASSERAHN